MPTSRRIILTILAASVAVAVAQPLPWAAASKDFPLCVQACNSARAECSNQCGITCQNMFPDNKQSRDACIGSCKDECILQSNDCKDECQAIKDGGSPPEP